MLCLDAWFVPWAALLGCVEDTGLPSGPDDHGKDLRLGESGPWGVVFMLRVQPRVVVFCADTETLLYVLWHSMDFLAVWMLK
jgi:hypothetical protein